MQTYEKILPPRHDFASEKEKEKVTNSKRKVIPYPQIVCGGGIIWVFFKKEFFGTFCKFLALLETQNKFCCLHSLNHINYIML